MRISRIGVGGAERLARARWVSTLQVGHWTVAPLVRRIGIVYRGGQQYWFYMQLLAIAETGSPDLSLGCLRALLKNLASETEGVDSVGVVYRGLGK